MSAIRDIWFIHDYLLPTLDVLLLSFLLYKSYQILVETRAVQLIRGAIFLGGLYLIAFVLDLRTLLWIINLLVPSFVIGIAIIFQPELRKIFTRIGQGTWLYPSRVAQVHLIDSVISTLQSLARAQTGALIVFSRSVGQKNIIETGTRIDGELSRELLLSIFENGSALHDGAVVIEGGRLAAAGCFLPLSEQTDVRRSFGTRHRAALGLAEESDALVLVVSEETGAISIAYDANLYYDLTADEIRERLQELLRSGAAAADEEEVAELGD